MNALESMFSLRGKTALVTGGYRGLGLSIARGLAEAGAAVVLNGRGAEGVAESVAALRGLGLEAEGAPFDILDEAAAARAVGEILERRGAIDILVNNAGIHRRNRLLDMPLADFRAALDTNLTAAFVMAKLVAPGMIARGGGKILNVCSLMSELARPTTGNYAAAKGGLKMLTRAMAAEWAAHNVQANGIAPGYFETELTRPLKDDPAFDAWIRGRTPSGRWGQPEDLKGLAVLLASPASNYINGQIIFIDGGLTAVI